MEHATIGDLITKDKTTLATLLTRSGTSPDLKGFYHHSSLLDGYMSHNKQEVIQHNLDLLNKPITNLTTDERAKFNQFI